MPVSPEYKADILSILNLVAPVTSRAMFGGLGLYCEGLFFALAANDTLYFKVDDSNRQDFIAAGMEPWTYGAGYYELPPFVLDNPEELAVWMDKSIRVAELKRARSPARSRRRLPKPR